eukprot:jgi/Ulvmu1/7882/UM004_0113.1
MRTSGQFECLRGIRLAIIQCSRYDAVPDAALQSLALEPRLADGLVQLEGSPRSHGQTLTQLCVATGQIMYLSNRKIQSIPLARLRAALLERVQDACVGAVPHHVASCYGVIASVLLQATGSHQAALPLQRCIMAALTACIYVQVSATPSPAYETQPIVMYSNSISAAFGSCVLEAKSDMELRQLMMPLLHMLRGLCVPTRTSAEVALTEEARTLLQRLVVPLASQILQRLRQVCHQDSAVHSVLHATQPSPVQANQAPMAKDIHHEESGCAQIKDAAADAALLLAMAYHGPSTAHTPNLPQCISQALLLLNEGPTPTSLLAIRLPIPNSLKLFQDTKRSTLPLGEPNYETDRCMHEAACLRYAQDLRIDLRDNVLPALRSPGHWEDTAKFMMTMLQACMPQKQGQSSCVMFRGEVEMVAWWSKFIQGILHVLAALTASCAGSRTSALELAAAVLSSCPEACTMKKYLCYELGGLLVVSSIDKNVWPDLNKFMQAVALFCESPGAVRSLCQMCAVLSLKEGTTTIVCGVAVALVWVCIYGDPVVVPEILQMVENLLVLIEDKVKLHACLAEIRSALNKCHDCRKKPQCVRWFHRQVQAFSQV